jgi:hypothetical protein
MWRQVCNLPGDGKLQTCRHILFRPAPGPGFDHVPPEKSAQFIRLPGVLVSEAASQRCENVLNVSERRLAMLRPLMLSAMLGIATVGGLAATPSQAEARPPFARVYIAPSIGPSYGYAGVYPPGVSYYYDPAPSYYVAPDYGYSPGYYSYSYYAAPVYGYRSFYSYPGYYHHHRR